MGDILLTKVAIIGDHFVRGEVLQCMLQRYVEPVTGELEYDRHVLSYPHSPAVDNDSVRESIGDPDYVLEAIGGAQIVVNHMAPLTREVIEKAPHVEIIGSCRTEPVNVDLEAATKAGIVVVYAPGRNARAVAEFTIGLIIAETRNLARGHSALAQGIWRSDLYTYENAPHELCGQTIGLIGFGHIGSLLPSYLEPFQVRVLAYDPYVTDEVFTARGAERCHDMKSLLRQSDIVSLHARVTPETVGFIGEEQFRQMKQGTYFINTARGPMVDYGALYRALTDGHLRGAGIETFAVEPVPADDPLLKLPNVTLTPHIAGCSSETVDLVATMIARDIANFYAGRPLQHCANPEVL